MDATNALSSVVTADLLGGVLDEIVGLLPVNSCGFIQ